MTRDVPLVVLAGKEYGSGSSRDWAAKGTMLLGVKAVIAQSFERIHRSNLVNMGVLPLEFADGASVASLGLTGRETFDLVGSGSELRPRAVITVRATSDDGSATVVHGGSARGHARRAHGIPPRRNPAVRRQEACGESIVGGDTADCTLSHSSHCRLSTSRR